MRRGRGEAGGDAAGYGARGTRRGRGEGIRERGRRRRGGGGGGKGRGVQDGWQSEMQRMGRGGETGACRRAAAGGQRTATSLPAEVASCREAGGAPAARGPRLAMAQAQGPALASALTGGHWLAEGGPGCRRPQRSAPGPTTGRQQGAPATAQLAPPARMPGREADGGPDDGLVAELVAAVAPAHGLPGHRPAPAPASGWPGS